MLVFILQQPSMTRPLLCRVLPFLKAQEDLLGGSLRMFSSFQSFLDIKSSSSKMKKSVVSGSGAMTSMMSCCTRD